MVSVTEVLRLDNAINLAFCEGPRAVGLVVREYGGAITGETGSQTGRGQSFSFDNNLLS